MDKVYTLQELAAPAAADAAACPDENEAFLKIVSNMPSLYQPTSNPTIRGLLIALAQGDCVVRDTLPDLKDQLFVVSASSKYLDRLGQNEGVERPADIGLADADYRDLIPVMSYVPKQIRQGIQDLLRIWYGEKAVYANVTSNYPEPYALVNGTTLVIESEGVEHTVDVRTEDYASIGAATAKELAIAINKQIYSEALIASVNTDALSILKHIAIRTNVIGSNGSIQITGGTANGVVGFPTAKATMSTISQPGVVYEVKNREIIVVMPSTPQVVKRQLEGAWYLAPNAASTLESGYVFDPRAKFSVSGIVSATGEALVAGTVKQTLVATLPSTWTATSGHFVISYGRSTEEGPIKFVEKPNSGGLVLDPSYVFKKSHAQGAIINFIRHLGPPVVPEDRSTRAAYVTGVAPARAALKALIRRVAASGITIRFIVLTPEYRFSNPALDTNEAV